ncbi:EamA/RhaT family transporter [uncultured Albimonas sp.]|uniref:EamA family transporter n=1 Tax=uncultured Albimonas sp. TaxID=1331701 RepID=UPI0030EC6D9C
METWVLLAVGAAFLQNLRFALQKRLAGALGSAGGAGARFVFAAPLAAAGLAGLCLARGEAPPAPTLAFLAFCIGGGLAQMAATRLIVGLFAHRNFAAAMAYTKTEALQTALFGAALLGDRLPPAAWAAIGLGIFGVLLISSPPEGLRLRALLDRRALIGIASGGLFGLSAVAYRGATLALPEGDAAMRALTALCVVTAMQAVLTAVQLEVGRRGDMTRLLRAWRPGLLVGLAGVGGSLGWFCAFALRDAASVRVVGQVEVVFTLAASVLMFGERPGRRELAGVLVVSLAIVALVLATR